MKPKPKPPPTTFDLHPPCVEHRVTKEVQIGSTTLKYVITDCHYHRDCGVRWRGVMGKPWELDRSPVDAKK
jgi:hypothetical protein